MIDPRNLSNEELSAMGRVLIWINQPVSSDWGSAESGWFSAEWNNDYNCWLVGLRRVEGCSFVESAVVTVCMPLPEPVLGGGQ